MNLQYLKHRLSIWFFKFAVFGAVLIMSLWGMNAEASPGEYVPAPPKTTAQVLMEISDSCLNREILVLSVINNEGKRVYFTFLCQLKFVSDKPPKGEEL